MKYDVESIKKRKKRIELIKKIIAVILIILVYNLILVFISSDTFNNGIRIFGYKAYIITSTSMEPSINLGDVVITRKCKEDKLQTGDIITFKTENEIITHRILKIEDNGLLPKTYITKGDNNNIEDIEKVTYSNIEGKSVIIIPYLGKIIMIIDNKIIILIIVLIILITCFLKMQKQDKIENRREKKKIEEEKNKNKKNSYSFF